MTDNSKLRGDAEVQFKKAQRATEGAQAMADYVADVQAVRVKTARLKELRLAKQAAESQADKTPGSKSKKARKPLTR